MVRSDTRAPPPANAPNATPVLRTFARSTPKKTLIESPRSIEAIAICFVTWSSVTKSAAAIAARRQASARVTFGSPVDEIDEDAADDRQHQHRDDRAQVERARPDANHRNDAAEEVQVRVGDLGDELQEGIEVAVVWNACEPRHQDADEDDHDVDREQGPEVVRDVHACEGGDHR